MVIKVLFTKRTTTHTMDKQFAFAVLLIIIGVALSQSGTSDSFYIGLGYGIVVMGSFWIVLRIIHEIRAH